ncbi:unnamed protein product [Phytophthora lilii]|uniref:Unnamed protein product n=1 Tax=Phytophthora lilii TaxID=2077276 RepID=A0A9W7CR26_9STRA|nr:unnamed protein product [Phytophthora lilii]
MAPSRFPRASTILVAAILASTSGAIDFEGQQDITQSTGPVAPNSETQLTTVGGNGFGDQWAQTASSSNNLPTYSVAWSGGWSQPTTNEGPPSAWAPSSGQTSEYNAQDLGLECSGTDESFSPGAEVSLECSGSDEEEESQPGTTEHVPSSTVSSSSTASSIATGTYEDAGPTTSTSSQNNPASPTASSKLGNEQESSQTTQLTPTTTPSSSDTASSRPTSSGTSQQEESSTAQAPRNSTSSGKHATFGTITSKAEECVVGNPNTYIGQGPPVGLGQPHRKGSHGLRQLDSRPPRGQQRLHQLLRSMGQRQKADEKHRVQVPAYAVSPTCSMEPLARPLRLLTVRRGQGQRRGVCRQRCVAARLDRRLAGHDLRW